MASRASLRRKEAKSTGNVENDKSVYEFPNEDNKLTLFVKGITGRVKYQ